MNAQLVPATRELFDKFHGRPVPKTLKATVVMEGEKILGYAGYYPQDGGLVVIGAVATDVRPRVRNYAKAFVTAIHKTMREAKSFGVPIYALADPNIEGSEVLLEHYGFQRHKKEIFVWPGQ